MNYTEPTVNGANQTDDVDAIIRRNDYKLTADKIKQILSKVQNSPSHWLQGRSDFT